MPRRTPRLDVVAPCPLRWEELAGGDRVRFCGHCQQHVYNVASLSMNEVMALVSQREGRPCVRLQHRADGTVITRDCLHAVRRARERLVATAIGVSAMAVSFWSGVGALHRLVAGALASAPPPPASPPPRAEPLGPDATQPDLLASGKPPAPEEPAGRSQHRGMKKKSPKASPPTRAPEEHHVRMGRMRVDPLDSTGL
jgi:hypothetical protein